MPDSDLTVAIIGGETLLGRELRERLESRGLAAEIELIAAGEQVLSAAEDEAAVIPILSPERVEDADVVLIAASGESARKVLALVPPEVLVIDASGALEDLPEARIRKVFRSALEPARVHIVAHPAALAIATVLGRVHAFRPIRHAVVHVFEPASERGTAGIQELQQQTTSLLSFRPLERRVFDAQLSFCLLPRYGSDAPVSLEDVELRIERNLASLLEGAVPMPSLRLVQAPVFHGHSYSFWISFEAAVAPAELAEALKPAGIDLRGLDVEPPTNVGSAGQSDVAVGLIEADRNDSRAVWLWAATDNLRLAADAALAILEEARP